MAEPQDTLCIRIPVPSAARVGRVLALNIAFLVLVHVVTYCIAQSGFGLGRTARLFDLDQEANITTWYSSFLLLASAIISYALSLATRGRGASARWWLALALIFVCMSIDETAVIHEFVGPAISDVLGIKARGFLHLPWVVPGLGAVGLVAVFFGRFVWGLPTRVRWLSFVSAGLYVGGAIGCEMIGAYLLSTGMAPDSWRLRLEIVFEESLEMSGVSLWICSQLLYLRQLQGAEAQA